MAAYYNENDKFAAAWLRELIKAGLIADGEVDERSIVDVRPADLAGFMQCHFFAGIGGWSYALRLAGWPDDRCVWTGSCPCQPFSAAGRGNGEQDARHLWPVWYPLIRKCLPATVFGEQIAASAGISWLDTVLYDLEESGYSVAAANLCAASVAAPHARQRLWFVADANNEGPYLPSETRQDRTIAWDNSAGFSNARGGVSEQWRWGGIESQPLALVNGIPNRVGQLRGFGNAIVPQVAQVFIEAYLDVVGRV